MTVNEIREGSKITLEVCGRLDTITSPDLEAQVRALPEELTDLVFDLSGLEYISSAGLRVLLASQKIFSKKGSMKVINVNDEINEIFDVTGFSDILTVE